MPKKGFGIEVYLRTRPTPKPAPGLFVNDDENYVRFEFEKDLSKDYVNNQGTIYQFNHFKQVMPMNITQEKVFDTVGKDVVDSCFDGYNGTIFAYGQTASGKTFTITGGADRYEDRGLIPRTLSYIFNQISTRSDTSYKVLVSYLEIYNGQGFDLLDENHSSKNLFDLPKVQMFENEMGQFVLKNLSIHKADNEEDALNLLFIGDTNRVVSETPMNDASTRSHCIFIIQLEAQKLGEDVKKVSKLQLVDLSGSERVAKSGVDGTILKEAKNINLSLHFLQQVIVNLNKKSRGENVHVPYRNNMMTMVLRDSIGGNCKTRMIATIHAKLAHINESLDTCQFARRVSLIENDARVNQVADPAVIIGKLKKEIADLKAEICLVKGTDDVDEHLSPDDIEE
jgi:kinesin family protein 6/9